MPLMFLIPVFMASTILGSLEIGLTAESNPAHKSVRKRVPN